ncbi:MAG TPA: DUF3592 domain-containing protein [Opitutaceae bacterium]|jgi:hypothetical protein|nr:DUF3592 domain-containing protein [Opitutaceae bacterium]
MTTGRMVGVGVLWLVLLAAGVWGLLELRDQQRMAQTEAGAVNWMPLSAKVLTVSVRPVEHPRPLGPRFYRRINYGYEVDGIEYSSTRYSFGGDQKFRTRAQAEAAQPGAGQPIEIYFNPAVPSEAVVQPHAAASLKAWRFRYGLPLLAVADGLLLLVAAKWLRMISRRRRARPLSGGGAPPLRR